jgi:hypothetical protein
VTAGCSWAAAPTSRGVTTTAEPRDVPKHDGPRAQAEAGIDGWCTQARACSSAPAPGSDQWTDHSISLSSPRRGRRARSAWPWHRRSHVATALHAPHPQASPHGRKGATRRQRKSPLFLHPPPFRSAALRLAWPSVPFAFALLSAFSHLLPVPPGPVRSALDAVWHRSL